MKKGLMLSLLLGTLFLLPALALGESWADFVARTDEALAEAYGEVVIQVESPVEAYALSEADPRNAFVAAYTRPEDVPLVVPEGVSLVLEGGEFSAMLLGGGEMTLRGVEVKGKSGQPSLCLAERTGAKGTIALRLTIDQASAVTSGDTDAVLSCVPEFKLAWDIRIHNQGVLRAGDGDIDPMDDIVAAVDMPMWGRRDLAFHLENDGEISGMEGVTLYTGTPPLYRMTVQNNGRISGVYAGISLLTTGTKKDQYVMVLNGPEGVLEGTGEGSNAFWFAGYGKQGLTQFINEGTLRSGGSPVQLIYTLDKYMPLEFLNSGAVEAPESMALVDVRLQQSARKTEDVLDAEKLSEQMVSFLEAVGLDNLPRGSKVPVHLDSIVGESYQSDEVVVELSASGAEKAPMEWAEFITRVGYIKAMGQGDIPIYMDRKVSAYKRMAKPISAGTGQRIVLHGGQYESILLGTGDILLEGVTVESAVDGQTAIYLDNEGNGANLRLELDADTVVRATGAESTGLGTWSRFNEAVSLTVTNHGLIESTQQHAVDFRPQVISWIATDVLFDNQGTVRGAANGIAITAQTVTGAAGVTLRNAGTIEGAAGYGAYLAARGDDAKVHIRVENSTEGVLRSGQRQGLCLDIQESISKGNHLGSDAMVRNEGTIQGASAAVQLETMAAHPVLVELRGEGTWQSGEGSPTVDAWLKQEYRTSRDNPMNNAVFGRRSDIWARLTGLRYFPENFELSACLYYWKDGEVPQTLYRQSFSGGDQGMPTLAMEETNYDLPIYLRYHGDGTPMASEVRDDALLAAQLLEYRMQQDGSLWFQVDGQMVQDANYPRSFNERPIQLYQRGRATYSNGGLTWVLDSFASKQKAGSIPGVIPVKDHAFVSLGALNAQLGTLYPGAKLEASADNKGVFTTTLQVGERTLTLPAADLAQQVPGFLAPEAETVPDFQIYVTVDGQIYIDLNRAQFDVMTLAALLAGGQPNVAMLTAE